MKEISLFLIATTKFLLAPASGLAMKLPAWEVLIVSILGGVTGVIVYYNLAGRLMKRAKQKKLLKIKEGKIIPKNFTLTNKTLVKIKHFKLGLILIAFVTPVLVSIPIGSIVCAKFYKKSFFTLPLLFTSVVIWAVVLTYFSDYVLNLF
jgi:membrane protein DedA with SNARE-associated domain